MKQDQIMKTLLRKYSHKVYKLRSKIRKNMKDVIASVLRDLNSMRDSALDLSNVYYLDYDSSNETMLWTGFNENDEQDKADLDALKSYLEGDQDLYHEMRLEELPLLDGYLRWSVTNRRSGYAAESQSAGSINPQLDKKLGYLSCIHIPLCKDYRPQDEFPGIDRVIGDIILAHPDKDGILGSVMPSERQKAVDLIAERLYKRCRLKVDYMGLRASKQLLGPVLKNVRKEFSYFFDTSLRSQYLCAVNDISRTFSDDEKKDRLTKSLLHFLYRLNNMLNGAKQGLVSIDEIIELVYGDATPLLNWLKHLGKGELFFSDVTHYREHLRHIISVYMLGIIALASGYGHFVLRQFEGNLRKLAERKGVDTGSILCPDLGLLCSMWTVIVFSHDALYVLEKTPKIVGTLDKLLRGDLKKNSSSRKTNDDVASNDFYTPHVLGNIGSVAKHLVEMEELSGRKINNVGVGSIHRFNQTLCGLLTRHAKHDTLAGIALEIELRKKVKSNSSSTKLWERVNKSLISDKTHYYKNVVTTAVAYHHGWTSKIKLSNEEKDFEMPKTWLEMHPLLVLLGICDGVHNWGREPSYKRINQICFERFSYRKNELVFFMNLACSEDSAKRICDGYRKHLLKPFKKAIFCRRAWKIRIRLSNPYWGRDRVLNLT